MSLARQHFQRMTAAAVAAATDPGAPVNANAYELQLIAAQGAFADPVIAHRAERLADALA